MEKIIKLTPKQYSFYKSMKREVIYSGSFGSGKSVATCVKLLPHALIPGNLCLLTRKTRQSLVSTTLRTLLIGDGKLPPILPVGSYKHNESKSEIKLHNGGTIIYRGCDDDFAIRSLNLGACAVDEAVELNEIEWDTLTSRLRSPVDPHCQIFAATNPSSPNHFLYKRWKDNRDIVDMITSTIYDNPHLPEAYVKDQVARYTGTNFKRYILGEWVTNEGAVYVEFDTDKHLVTKEDKYQTHIISLDIGFRDPTVILIAGYNDEEVHIFDEIYTNKMTPTEIIDKVKELKKQWINSVVVIDKSAAGVKTQATSMGLTMIDSNSDIKGGIMRTKELLTKCKLTVDKKCANLIREFDIYSWKDNKTDVPEDANNHCVDSLRYCLNHWYDNKATKISPTIFTVDSEGKEDKKEESLLNKWLMDD